MSHRAGILPVMHFSPHTASVRACWHCTHSQALVYGATTARCLRAGRLSIQAAPTTGCVLWEGEVGADDEAGLPISGDAVPRHDRVVVTMRGDRRPPCASLHA